MHGSHSLCIDLRLNGLTLIDEKHGSAVPCVLVVSLYSWMNRWTGHRSCSSMVHFRGWDWITNSSALSLVGLVVYLPTVRLSRFHRNIYISIRCALSLSYYMNQYNSILPLPVIIGMHMQQKCLTKWSGQIGISSKTASGATRGAV